MIAARFMRQDFFDYRPQFKLTIIGNHAPALKNVDAAARRRFNIVPFDFTPPEPDSQLSEKLKAEWPGILRWMIEGCLDWQRNGLLRPEVVTAATEAYFEDQNLVAQWQAERCETLRGVTESSSALFRDWADWAKSRGEPAGTNKAFSARLERTHRKIKARDGAVFSGLRLLPNPTGAW